MHNKAEIHIETLSKFQNSDLSDLCQATEATILDDHVSFNIGFNHSYPPVREKMESYWQGVLLVPERELIVGRLDGVIAASLQLVKPTPSNQTSSFAGTVEHHFVAPWARGHGLAKELLQTAETIARKANLSILRLSVRENLKAAISLYEANHYKRWGVLEKYERIHNTLYSGYFYYKEISHIN